MTNQDRQMGPSAVSATILVVDDEPMVRLPLVFALEDRGFTVLEASTGDQALAMLQAWSHVDLVLSDIRMPGKTDGMQLANHLRNTRPELPVILTSGHAPKLPADAWFLPKPYDLDALLALVDRLLTNRAGASGS
jgi:CheY-like chemotaxis protein